MRAVKLSAKAQELLPRHVAVIMDGNGRWAKEQGLPRAEGHRRGAESAKAITRVASDIGIRYLTLYTFSTENWSRPKTEIDAIMAYLVYYVKQETPELDKYNVRLEVIGQVYRLPEKVQNQLKKSKKQLSKNTGLTLVLALNYGSRAEIVDATRIIAEKVESGELVSEDIDETLMGMHLYTSQIPDPD
ncbi:MAG: polyprenyl diphosphate synthase, partial [Pseudomonadales bacterium]|nr:polyprenyl diphosphate synthase [Pseudomonadales bacterium]